MFLKTGNGMGSSKMSIFVLTEVHGIYVEFTMEVFFGFSDWVLEKFCGLRRLRFTKGERIS